MVLLASRFAAVLAVLKCRQRLRDDEFREEKDRHGVNSGVVTDPLKVLFLYDDPGLINHGLLIRGVLLQ